MTTSIPKPSLCSKCETLPKAAPAAGRLHLWFPLGHSAAKVVSFLARLEAPHRVDPDEGCVVTLGPDDEGLVNGLAQLLSREEQGDTKALFLTEDRPPAIGDFARVTTLREFIVARASSWLVDMLADERYESWFQPVVEAAAPHRVHGHEALFRGLDAEGELVPPGKVFEVAHEAGLLFQADLRGRLSAIAGAKRVGGDGRFFVNFNPTAIYDPAFCLRSTLRAITEAGIANDRLVFEIVQSDRIVEPGRLAVLLDFYREKGFRVALDDVGSGASSLGLIGLLRPDYVKIEMALVRGVDADPYKASIVRRLIEIARELGITSVAKGIETPAELAWLQAHGVDLVQGQLVGAPAAAPGAAVPA